MVVEEERQVVACGPVPVVFCRLGTQNQSNFGTILRIPENYRRGFVRIFRISENLKNVRYSFEILQIMCRVGKIISL